MNDEPIISLTDITKTFKLQPSPIYPEGKFYALNKINMKIFSGDCIVIGGANGSGKTVLMSVIAGLTKPTSGKIIQKTKVGLIFQDADTQILGETPREDIAFGLPYTKNKKEEVKNKIDKALRMVSLIDKADFPARSLSGGEKRKLTTAGILAMNTDVFIFDEPFANLDFDGVKQVIYLIKDLKKNKKTVIILTHEIEKCLALAERFIILYKGKIVFDGTAQDGIKSSLEKWGIRNPIRSYSCIQDLIWE